MLRCPFCGKEGAADDFTILIEDGEIQPEFLCPKCGIEVEAYYKDEESESSCEDSSSNKT